MLVVTGVSTNLSQQKEYLGELNVALGVTAKLVPNASSGGAIDVGFAVAGLLSHGLGVLAEREAVRGLYREMLKQLRDAGEVKLLVFSQGTIITSNTLFMLRERYLENGTPEKWEALASRISITAIGAATHVWPKEIQKIESVAFPDDLITKVTLPLVRLYQKIKDGAERWVEPEIREFSERPKHSFTEYLRHLQGWFKERFCPSEDQKESPRAT